jgi:hypothetical protein
MTAMEKSPLLKLNHNLKMNQIDLDLIKILEEF